MLEYLSDIKEMIVVAPFPITDWTTPMRSWVAVFSFTIQIQSKVVVVASLLVYD